MFLVITAIFIALHAFLVPFTQLQWVDYIYESPLSTKSLETPFAGSLVCSVLPEYYFLTRNLRQLRQWRVREALWPPLPPNLSHGRRSQTDHKIFTPHKKQNIYIEMGRAVFMALVLWQAMVWWVATGGLKNVH